MKTAVLICGRCPSNYLDFYESIYKTLIEPYNSDVFLSSWKGDFDENELLSLYKPISSQIEDFEGIYIKKRMDEFFEFLKDNSIENVPLTMYPLYYKVYHANQLRLNYQIRNKMKYDLVIRTRFDLNFGLKMQCNTIEPFIFNSILPEEIEDSIQNDNLYLRLDPFMGNRIINDWIWDQFAFGNDKNMNVYCNTYLNLEKILLSKRENVNINEKVLYYNLKDNNVSLKHTHTTYLISTHYLTYKTS